MRFTVARCRRIITSGIFTIATAVSFHGFWSGSIFLHLISTVRLNYRAKNRFPSSGELNFRVSNAASCIEGVQQHFISKASSIDSWMACLCLLLRRFNLRKSNTEPLVRLNIETKGDHALLKKKQKN